MHKYTQHKDIQHEDTQHKDTQDKVSSINTLSINTLSIKTYWVSTQKLSVIMPSVIILGVVMLSVVAPRLVMVIIVGFIVSCSFQIRVTSPWPAGWWSSTWRTSGRSWTSSRRRRPLRASPTWPSPRLGSRKWHSEVVLTFWTVGKSPF